MNVSLRYQTHSRGRCTSSTSYTMGEIPEHPCASFTGVLANNREVVLDSTAQLWLSSDHPVDIESTNSLGETTTITGMMLYTSEFNPPLRSVRIKRSSWVEEDDKLHLDFQAFTSAFAVRDI